MDKKDKILTIKEIKTKLKGKKLSTNLICSKNISLEIFYINDREFNTQIEDNHIGFDEIIRNQYKEKIGKRELNEYETKQYLISVPEYINDLTNERIRLN